MPLAVSPAIHLPPAAIPPKIQAALAWTGFCEHVQHQMVQSSVGVEKSGRRLTTGEQRCYDAAVSCLTEYFNEDGFGDGHPPQPPGGGNAPVINPVPVKTP